MPADLVKENKTNCYLSIEMFCPIYAQSTRCIKNKAYLYSYLQLIELISHVSLSRTLLDKN